MKNSATITEPKPIVAPEMLEQLQSLTEVEKQVIVHCCFPATPYFGSLIRIWPTTFLVDDASGCRSQLVHSENISIAPYWTEVPPMKDFWFTLIFAGLPKGCTQFDLKELIAEEGGFCVPNIRRNATDVYRVKIE